MTSRAQRLTVLAALYLQISVLGVLRLVTNPAGLAAAGAVGFPVLTGASVLLAALGTWVMVRWLRGAAPHGRDVAAPAS